MNNRKLSAADSYTYEEVTGSNIDTCVCTIENTSSGNLFKIEYTEETYSIRTDNQQNTIGCYIIKKENERVVHCERLSDIIEITEGKEVKKVEISDLKWLQTPFTMHGFIKGDEKQINFVQITYLADTSSEESIALSGLEIIARKEKNEKMMINRIEEDVIRTTITLPGFKSLFRKITYWYRKSDGVVVAYHDRRGGPETPVTIGIRIVIGQKQ